MKNFKETLTKVGITTVVAISILIDIGAHVLGVILIFKLLSPLLK